MRTPTKELALTLVNTLTHQMAISYRTSKGTFYTYIGNITDFYNQIVKIVETARNSEKFGL